MYNAKYFRYEDVDDDLVESWKNLGLRSREDNAYLSPDFVLPAIKYLADDSRVYITAAYREEDSSLCGIGVFTYRFGTIDFPLPHFESFKSTHSYLTGVLLEEVDALNILKEMLSLIKRSSPRVFGIKFSDLAIEGQMGEILGNLEQSGSACWCQSSVTERACLDIPAGGKALDHGVSAKRRKNYRHTLNKLNRIEKVSWRLVTANEVTSTHVETFMYLEDKGWKNETETSLLSVDSHRDFFVECIREFAASGNVFFTELKLGDRVIASTCNLVAGKSAFAFKIGWDVDYQKYSPGVINEMEFLNTGYIRNLPIECIDSGASEDSFINNYWPGRKVLAKGVLAFNPIAELACIVSNSARRWKRSLGRMM